MSTVEQRVQSADEMGFHSYTAYQLLECLSLYSFSVWWDVIRVELQKRPGLGVNDFTFVHSERLGCTITPVLVRGGEQLGAEKVFEAKCTKCKTRSAQYTIEKGEYPEVLQSGRIKIDENESTPEDPLSEESLRRTLTAIREQIDSNDQSS